MYPVRIQLTTETIQRQQEREKFIINVENGDGKIIITTEELKSVFRSKTVCFQNENCAKRNFPFRLIQQKIDLENEEKNYLSYNPRKQNKFTHLPQQKNTQNNIKFKFYTPL